MTSTEERDGPTPAGGVRSVAYYTDGDGRPADRSAATRVEIVELDADGGQLARHYGSLRPGAGGGD